MLLTPCKRRLTWQTPGPSNQENARRSVVAGDFLLGDWDVGVLVDELYCVYFRHTRVLSSLDDGLPISQPGTSKDVGE